MRSFSFPLFALLCGVAVPCSAKAGNPAKQAPPPAAQHAVAFEENAGQIRDQFGRPRPDVLYSGSSEGLNFHVRRDGISYQLVRVEHMRPETKRPATGVLDEPAMPDSFTVHRIDLDWLAHDLSPRRVNRDRCARANSWPAQGVLSRL